MKKNKKLVIVFVIAIIIMIATLGIITKVDKKSNSNIIIVDNNGKVISEHQNSQDSEDYETFIDVVMKEVKGIIGENISGNYIVKTTFDKTAFDSCSYAYSQMNYKSTPFAAVITDNDGRILSVFSNDENKNYAIQKTQPYSSLKPLSVYAPAIENGTASWSSKYFDSPVKQVLSENGEYVDWPANGTGKYTETDLSIVDGIKISLNTTAVRCLMELGVDESVKFLTEKLALDIEEEEKLMALNGEDEILHNIGLGYLIEGVTPVDMAGYYQIFANGGCYIKPYSVLEIVDENGAIIYTAQPEKVQVISNETAYIMNLLLQNTLSEGGTAHKAKYKDVQIGGKTGTGSGRTGNWFVGFTPEYSFSIWHGEYPKNVCAETFSHLISKMEYDTTKRFPLCPTVKQCVYCEESGDKLTINCNSMGTGYFTSNYVFKECDIHSSNK